MTEIDAMAEVKRVKKQILGVIQDLEERLEKETSEEDTAETQKLIKQTKIRLRKFDNLERKYS